jgi:hypothetical protein
MGLFTGIFNKARTMSSHPTSPTQADANRKAPGLTVIPGSTGGTAAAIIEGRSTGAITPADVAELLSYSRVLDSKAQYEVFPIDESSWSGDPFNAKYLVPKYLGDAGPGKSFFAQGIWALPNPTYSRKMIEAIIEESGGLSALCPPAWQADATEDLRIWSLTQEIGMSHSLSAAYRIATARTDNLANHIARDGASLDSQMQPDLEGVQAHCRAVLNACREIQAQVSKRHAARMQPIAQKCRAAAIRLVERQVELEERRSEEEEMEFRSSPKLLALLHFAMIDRIGASGHLQGGCWNVITLGCSLPPNPAPWGGVQLFAPPPEYLEQQRLLTAALKFNRPPTSTNRRDALRKPDLSSIKL